MPRRFLRDYDLIVDGSDNFATRYLTNDVAVFARQAERLRLDLSLRRAGDGLRAASRRSLLSLSFSRAAVAGVRAKLRGSGSARRAAGNRRHDPGDGGVEVDSRHRRNAARPVAAFRCAEDEVPRIQSAARSGMSGLRRRADDHGADRLRGFLSGAPAAESLRREKSTSQTLQRKLASGGAGAFCSMCASRLNGRSRGSKART